MPARRRRCHPSASRRSVRKASGLPVAVGFGIRTPADAARFAAIADGVVVGTALVDRVASGAASVAELVRGLAAAMRR